MASGAARRVLTLLRTPAIYPAQASDRIMSRFIGYVPNAITLLRLAAVPVLVWLILTDHLGPAFWLFVACGVSDGVDGFIARSFSARTKLGAYLDPIADKALLVGSFTALGFGGHLPLWLVALVVLRDIVIVSGVSYLSWRRERLAMQPLWISKLNTLLQIVLAALVLAVAGAGYDLGAWVMPLVIAVALTSGWSLIAYVLRGILILRSPGEGRASGSTSREEGA